jgi:hypothetical protein
MNVEGTNSKLDPLVIDIPNRVAGKGVICGNTTGATELAFEVLIEPPL